MERLKRIFKLNFMGIASGTIFYCLSLTPSLLPRPPFFEGMIAGISFALGYAFGVFLSWLVRLVVPRCEPPANIKRWAWATLLVVAVFLMAAYALWQKSWQNQVRVRIGEQPLQSHHSVTIILTAFVFASMIILAGRLIGWAIRVASAYLGRWVPARLSAAAGTLVVAIILVLFYNGVIVRAFVSVSNNVYKKQNVQTAPGVRQPTDALRSGSSASLVRWNALGYQGRSFVAGAPTQKQIGNFDNSQSAQDPIRVYVGLGSAKDAAERARLAVKELERTGAFDRPVLAVMTSTGSGWVEPQAAASLEYMWHGDTALVSMQYSYLPSWISFLVDQDKATEAGRALYDAVYARWQQLPVNHRPKLIAFGLSLGSYGAQADFSGTSDMQNRTSGALFMGTPSFTPLRNYFVNGRDKGSPQWQPVYQNGQTVRFAAQGDDLKKPAAAWAYPRIVYMQHASDPVVWWSPNLIWHKPDWLKETRGADVTPNMQWYPFVTFAQVTVDQFFSTSPPVGHGHNYSNSEVAAWSAITSPPNWSAQKAQKLQHIISDYPI